MFSIGQKVVCIGDFTSLVSEYWARELCIEFPEKGKIYTVRRIVQRPCGDGETAYGIMLVEVVNIKTLMDRKGLGGVFPHDDPRSAGVDEIAFDSRDFRPLITVEKFMRETKKEPVAS